METKQTRRKLWEHPDPKGTQMWAFMQQVNEREGLNLRTFDELYKWSCDNRSRFFGQLWESQGWIYEGRCDRVVDEAVPISRLPRWFDGLRLNYAENLLWSRGADTATTTARTTALGKEDDRVAVTEIREGNTDVRHVTWGELRSRAGEMAAALAARGVGRGDRVVIVGSHSVQTFIVLLATMWLGAVFSSSSTDMGVAGLLQRTVQVDPKFVFFDDAALYNGKKVDLRDKIDGMVQGMKQCSNFKGVVVIRRFDGSLLDTSQIERTERLEDFLRQGGGSPPLITRVGFQDPAMIFYSSGTTGTPKAIVHGVGTLLISLAKEARLHHDFARDDVCLQYTTTGWIMYVMSVGQLLLGGRTVFYDGSPLIPDRRVLLKIVEQQGVTVLGTSPRWMGEIAKAGIVPRRDFDLSRLRLVTSTGMVLPDQLFEWFYDVGLDPKVHLSNISGGTDIAGCFVLGNPLTPVYVGGTQGPSLGTSIAVFDHDLPEGSKGTPVPPGTPGDLVATAAFPNVPVCLWNDGDGPAPGPKYRDAYFSRFSEAWAQGDFCQTDPATGNVWMLGRSDGVLNPSGVRFGSADIYAVIERHFAQEVRESICVGQRRPSDVDERVVLFLQMHDGRTLDDNLAAKIRDAIAREFTKRHVPRFIFEMPEVPVTVNGKKVELPVKHIISGRTVKPSGTLLNPQSLDYFYRFQKVEELVSAPKSKL